MLLSPQAPPPPWLWRQAPRTARQAGPPFWVLPAPPPPTSSLPQPTSILLHLVLLTLAVVGLSPVMALGCQTLSVHSQPPGPAARTWGLRPELGAPTETVWPDHSETPVSSWLHHLLITATDEELSASKTTCPLSWSAHTLERSFHPAP